MRGVLAKQVALWGLGWKDISDEDIYLYCINKENIEMKKKKKQEKMYNRD